MTTKHENYKMHIRDVNKLKQYTKAKFYYQQTYYFMVEKWIEKELKKEYSESFKQSISQNQLICKEWLIEELSNLTIPKNSEGKIDIEIIGGWFGFPLLDLLYDLYGAGIGKIDFYDKDPFCHKVVWQYLNWCHFPLKVNNYGDYFEREEKRRRQLIINTSQEHMDYISMDWLKGSPVFVLQSNDMTHLEEHTNCVSSEEELVQKANINPVMYAGTKNLDNYNRFMVIGENASSSYR